MGDVVLGLETEYGGSFSDSSGNFVPPERGVAAALNVAKRELPCWLPDEGPSGFFLPNGGKIYPDSGHLEYASPETTNPADLVKYVLAGDRFLETVVAPGMREREGFRDARFYRNTTCYISGLSFGCHENYGARNRARDFRHHLLPHLCSRIIYSGAGGFSAHPNEIGFLLSARVAHLERVTSNNSTGTRPLFHTKDEPHGDDGIRIHIICGDGQRSPRAMGRRLGTTALVVALVDAGHGPGDAVELRDPLKAVRAFAVDPTCCAEAEIGPKGRGRLPAREIQFHYLGWCEKHLADLPDWAPDVCRDWRQALETELNDGAESAATDIEWAMKYQVYRDFLRKRGHSIDDCAMEWRATMSRVARVLGENGFETERSRVSVNALRELSETGPGSAAVDAALRGSGKSFDELLEYLAVRDRLFELDTRWNEIGEDSLYSAIRRNGGIEDGVPGIDADALANAIVVPPSSTRAKVRGGFVRELGRDEKTRASTTCDWTVVCDMRKMRVYEMTDAREPDGESRRWRKVRHLQREAPMMDALLRERSSSAVRLYERGLFEEAGEVMRALAESGWEAALPSRRLSFLRHSIRIHIRGGRLEHAEWALAEYASLVGRGNSNGGLIDNAILLYRHAGLRPGIGILPWFRRGMNLAHATDAAGENRSSRVSLYSTLGLFFCLNRGRPDLGLRYLRKARGIRVARGGTAMRNRLYCDLGRAYTMMGRPRDALYWYYKAREICEGRESRSELSDLVLPGLARLKSARPLEGLELLAEACVIQEELRNGVGETRTRLLQARLSPGDGRGNDARRDRVRHLASERSVVSGCPLFTKVMDHWEAFTSGAPDPEGIDDEFWGV